MINCKVSLHDGNLNTFMQVAFQLIIGIPHYQPCTIKPVFKCVRCGYRYVIKQDLLVAPAQVLRYSAGQVKTDARQKLFTSNPGRYDGCSTRTRTLSVTSQTFSL